MAGSKRRRLEALDRISPSPFLLCAGTTKHLVKAFDVLFPDVSNLFTLPVAEITASEVERYSLYKPESAQDEDPFIATKFTDRMPISQLLRK